MPNAQNGFHLDITLHKAELSDPPELIYVEPRKSYDDLEGALEIYALHLSIVDRISLASDNTVTVDTKITKPRHPN